MNMNREDKQAIQRAAKFLEDDGFQPALDNNVVIYEKETISFIIAYERYDDVSSIDVKFSDQNQAFDVGWIAFVREHLNTDVHKPLQNVLLLLAYIQAHLDEITEYSYCKESQEMIAKFISHSKN